MINLALDGGFVAVHASSLCYGHFPLPAVLKGHRPHIGEIQTFLHISRLRLFSFIRAKSRFAPLCSGVVQPHTVRHLTQVCSDGLSVLAFAMALSMFCQ